MLRRPAQLARCDLESIVDALQRALYLDFGADGTFVWNPEKAWNGADVCDALAAQLQKVGLVPIGVEVLE